MARHLLLIPLIFLATPAVAENVVPEQIALVRSPRELATTQIELLARTSIAIMTGEAQQDRRARLDELVRANFDMRAAAAFVFGRTLHEFDEATRARIIQAYQDRVIGMWNDRLASYGGQTLEVLYARDLLEAPDQVLVSTRINRLDGPPIKVDWRMRCREGRCLIIDVFVESLSMLAAQRSEIQSVMAGARTPDGILKALSAR